MCVCRWNQLWATKPSNRLTRWPVKTSSWLSQLSPSKTSKSQQNQNWKYISHRSCHTYTHTYIHTYIGKYSKYVHKYIHPHILYINIHTYMICNTQCLYMYVCRCTSFFTRLLRCCSRRTMWRLASQPMCRTEPPCWATYPTSPTPQR